MAHLNSVWLLYSKDSSTITYEGVFKSRHAVDSYTDGFYNDYIIDGDYDDTLSSYQNKEIWMKDMGLHLKKITGIDPTKPIFINCDSNKHIKDLSNVLTNDVNILKKVPTHLLCINL